MSRVKETDCDCNKKAAIISESKVTEAMLASKSEPSASAKKQVLAKPSLPEAKKNNVGLSGSTNTTIIDTKNVQPLPLPGSAYSKKPLPEIKLGKKRLPELKVAKKIVPENIKKTGQKEERPDEIEEIDI